MRPLAFALLAFSLPAQTPEPPLTIVPNDTNFAAWRTHIEPGADELVWEQIPWHSTFADGLAAASEQQKPLLFWAMNGHPLGCT